MHYSVDDWQLFAAGGFFFSALLALRGTNKQAAIAKRRLLADSNPLVAHAAALWAPGPRWIRLRKRRTSRASAEAEIKLDVLEWRRYTELLQEFSAWNDLESAVAIALPAAGIVAVISIIATWGK